MKNVLTGLVSRLDTAEERISEAEDRSRESLQTEIQEKNNAKITKTKRKHSRTVGQYQIGVTYV